MTLADLVGKTVDVVIYMDDPRGEDPYLTITFTDGTKLLVKETQQAGDILVAIDGEKQPNPSRNVP